MGKYVTLTLEGDPGTDVELIVRSNEDPPPEPSLKAAIGSDGVLRIVLPRAYYVALGKNLQTLSLHLENGPDSQTFRIGKD
jgi:hypothetical protein